MITQPFTESGIEQLPDNMPVVYYIKGNRDNMLYIGSAMRGRVRERLHEHRRENKIPGNTVSIERYHTIDDAMSAEKRAISIHNPPHNTQHSR